MFDLLFRCILVLFFVLSIFADNKITLKGLIGSDANNFESPDRVSQNLHISSTILPVYGSSTAPHSTAVSVTALSSALVEGFGDVYAIAILTVLDNGVEWQSESYSGSSVALPLLPKSDWPKDILQVQYDNRYGLFYQQPNMNSNFPANIVVLTATDKIRFNVIDKTVLGSCNNNYIEFTFFKPSTSLKKYLENSDSDVRNTTLSLLGMTEWPFGNLIFKLCPYNGVAVSFGINADNFESYIVSTGNITVHVGSTSTTGSPITTPTTTSMPSISVVQVYPTLFDLDADSNRILIIQTTNPLSGLSCLLSNTVTQATIGVAATQLGINTTVAFSTTLKNEATYFLNCAYNGKSILTNQTLLFASFRELVEISSYTLLNDGNSVRIDFKRQLNSDKTNFPVCIFGNNHTTHNTPLLFNVSSVVCALSQGENTYVVRRQELTDATFKYQGAVSILTSTSTTPQPLKATNGTTSATFLPTLDGIKIALSSDTGIGSRAFNCAAIFFNSASFGAGATCIIDNSQIWITFGSSPMIKVSGSVIIRTGALTAAYLDNPTASSTQYDTINVTVPGNAEAPNIVIVPPPDVLSCLTELTYSSNVIGGSGGRDLNYTWFMKSGGNDKLKSFLATVKQPIVNISLAILSSNSAEVLLQGCNFALICGNSTSVTVNSSSSTNAFVVEIVGVPPNPIPSQAITLYAEANMISCSGVESVVASSNVYFAWSVNDTIYSRDSVVTFRGKTFTAASIAIINLTVSYLKPNEAKVYNGTAVTILTFGSQPLVPIVDSTNRVISAVTDLTIDASRSYDPNSGSTVLTHSWTSDCISVPVNTSKLVLKAGKLVSGHQYTFLDTITNSRNTLTTSVAVNVLIKEGSVPTIQLRPVTDYEISTDDYFRIQAYVQSEESELTTQWYLFKATDNTSINLVSYFSNAVHDFVYDSPGGIVALSFTIPPVSTKVAYNGWPGLQSGAYVMRLVATNVNGSAFADYAFTVIASPGEPTISISPTSEIIALETNVRFNTNASVDDMLLYRFGLRTLFIDNTTQDRWYHQTAVDYFKTILASALPGVNASCSKRVGYQGLLEVCDRAGACATTNTDNIIVQHPINATAAIENILQLAMSDIATGNVEHAVVMLEAIKAEQCSSSLNSTIVDSLIRKVVENLANATDPTELLDGVIECARMMNSASGAYINKVFDLVIRSQELILSTDQSRRRKRATAATSLAALAAATVSTVPEEAADKLLFAYDGLISQNQNIASVYLTNIVDLLSGFCVQVDATRTMSSEGDAYTVIQAEGILPSDNAFLNTTFLVAGDLNGVSLSEAFKSNYLSYKCGQNGATICTEVCLASARISNAALHDNTYLSQYFFENAYTLPQYVNIASALYYVMFADPVTGNALTLPIGVTYNISIPLTTYLPSNYYGCFIFMNGIWDTSPCQSNNYARAAGKQNYMDCQCAVGGIVAVYTVNPPAAPFFYPYNEYQLTFNLSTINECKFSQLSTFVGTLSNASQVELKRFVNYSCAGGTDLLTNPATVSMVLRPPFMETQVSNSIAMQAINRAIFVGAASMFSNNVSIKGFSVALITRDLKGDGNARRMPLRLVKALKDIGNDTSTLLTKWIASLPRNMRLDPYRFKDPSLQYGLLFNFTITLPFVGESVATGTTALSAEEISLWIMEQTVYGELDLRDLQEIQVSIDPVAYTDIVQLVAISPTNTLMTVLGIVVAVGIVLISMITGGLVFLKLRTDRLIEQHNQNMRMVNVPVTNHHPIGAQPPLPTIIPFESNGMVLGPGGIIDPGIDKAADTVFFGQRDDLRMR